MPSRSIAEALQLSVGPGARFLDIHRILKSHGLALLSMTSGKGGTFIGWMATGGWGLEAFTTVLCGIN